MLHMVQGHQYIQCLMPSFIPWLHMAGESGIIGYQIRVYKFPVLKCHLISLAIFFVHLGQHFDFLAIIFHICPNFHN